MKRNEEEARIFAALSRVETPEYDIAGAVEEAIEAGSRPQPHPLPRAALLAACLAGVLLLAAAAAGISGAWRYFFRSELPQNAVTTVGVSQTAGGYTLTLEDVVVDDNGAMLLLALSRADGGDIDPEASLRTNSMRATLTVDGEDLGGSLSGAGAASEDPKKVYFCFEGRNHGIQESLLGKTMTFEAEGVAVQLREPDGFYQLREKKPADLSPLAGAWAGEPFETNHWEKEVQETLAAAIEAQDINVPLGGVLGEEFPGFALRGALMTDDGGLRVAVSSSGWVRSGDRVCTSVSVEALTDRRTGERYEYAGGQGIKLSDGSSAVLWYWRDCPLTVEDLPYLEMEVTYAVDRVLSEEPFSLTFRADGGSAVRVDLEGTLEVEGVRLHPVQLRLSALGLTFYFDDSMDTAHVVYEAGLTPVLTLEDGTALETEWHGGYGGEDGQCAIAFGAKDEDGGQVFFDTAQIRSVTFGGLTAALP